MNRDVARGQDIGKGGAESWGQHVGVGRIVCVCFMCLYCLSSSCVLNVISPFTVTRSFN
jgi:hypothetical protein